MKQIFDTTTMPFGELSKTSTEDNTGYTMESTDDTKNIVVRYVVPLFIFLASLGVLNAVLKAGSEPLSAGAGLIGAGLILSVTYLMFKRDLEPEEVELLKGALRHTQVKQFADKIGWVFQYNRDQLNLDGLPKKLSQFMGLESVLMDRADKPTALIGNVTLKSGKEDESTVITSLIAVKMDKPAKLLFLDSKSNETWRYANFHDGAGIELRQIELEGDFQQYFDLYCLPDHERETLYIFTPELMQVLIERASRYDMEIVGHWLLLYGDRKLDYSPDETREIFNIMNVVGGEFRDNTKNLA